MVSTSHRVYWNVLRGVFAALMVVLILLALNLSLASAQEATSPAFMTVEQTGAPEEAALTAALELIIKAITSATFVPVAAGFVVVVTGIAKHFIPEKMNAGIIALAVQVIVWVAWVLALHFGYADQFPNWVESMTTILTAVMGLAGSSYVASGFHKKAVEVQAPLAGYKRDSGVGSDI